MFEYPRLIGDAKKRSAAGYVVGTLHSVWDCCLGIQGDHSEQFTARNGLCTAQHTRTMQYAFNDIEGIMEGLMVSEPGEEHSRL